MYFSWDYVCFFNVMEIVVYKWIAGEVIRCFNNWKFCTNLLNFSKWCKGHNDKMDSFRILLWWNMKVKINCLMNCLVYLIRSPPEVYISFFQTWKHYAVWMLDSGFVRWTVYRLNLNWEQKIDQWIFHLLRRCEKWNVCKVETV